VYIIIENPLSEAGGVGYYCSIRKSGGGEASSFLLAEGKKGRWRDLGGGVPLLIFCFDAQR